MNIIRIMTFYKGYVLAWQLQFDLRCNALDGHWTSAVVTKIVPGYLLSIFMAAVFAMKHSHRKKI